jgi:hypothetical protein
MNKISSSNEYIILLNEIKERIRASQYSAFKAVNKELIGAYWGLN